MTSESRNRHPVPPSNCQWLVSGTCSCTDHDELLTFTQPAALRTNRLRRAHDMAQSDAIEFIPRHEHSAQGVWSFFVRCSLRRRGTTPAVLPSPRSLLMSQRTRAPYDLFFFNARCLGVSQARRGVDARQRDAQLYERPDQLLF
eukprot:6206789-Pleurochrysis_carterae.AAC.2